MIMHLVCEVLIGANPLLEWCSDLVCVVFPACFLSVWSKIVAMLVTQGKACVCVGGEVGIGFYIARFYGTFPVNEALYSTADGTTCIATITCWNPLVHCT